MGKMLILTLCLVLKVSNKISVPSPQKIAPSTLYFCLRNIMSIIIALETFVLIFIEHAISEVMRVNKHGFAKSGLYLIIDLQPL